MMKKDSQSVQPNSVSSLADINCEESDSAATLSERSCIKRKNEQSGETNDESFSESSGEISVEGGETKRLRLETPNYTDEERQRVMEILEREFNKELQSREEEALLIEERIQRAHRTLQYLCYAVVSDFYSRDKTITQQVTSTRQRRIHPAVKELLAGKHPKDSAQASSSSTEPTNQSQSIPSQGKAARTPPKTKKNAANSTSNSEGSSSTTKVPRYIPPKPKDSPSKARGPSRGVHNKLKQRIVIGNVSKWLPVESREDSASHKWMVYVRGPKDAPDISGFVEKVRFFLHPSYRPNDVVQVVQAPFHLSRRGWGEFPVRVQIHFQDPLNKPVDVIHHLKLDRTCTGLQTLGAETVVDVWINKNNNIRPLEQPDLQILSPVPQEFDEIFTYDEENQVREGLLHSSPTASLSSAITIQTERMSPPAVSNEEDSSTVVSSFLQKPSVSESSNIGIDFVSVSEKTDCDVAPPTPILSPGILVQSPSKGLRPASPSSNVTISSSSKISLKPATSTSSKVLLRPIAPVAPSGTLVLSPSVTQANQSPRTVLSRTTILRQTTPSVSSHASQSQLKPSLVSSPSKVLILNRSTLVSKPTTTSAMRSDVMSSPSTSNLIPAAKLVTVPSVSTNRLTNTLQSSIAGTKIVPTADSPAKILIPGGNGQILTSSGQVLKVVSPSKVPQNSNRSVPGPITPIVPNSIPNVVTPVTTTNAVSTVKAVQVPLTPKRGVPQNQNVLGAAIPKTPGSPAKPVSLVKYRAPDGSIRFLQVSQINTPNTTTVNQPQVVTPVAQNATSCLTRPRQLLVRPASEVKSNVQRNPPPVIRLPAPSNVTPTPNQGHVLMFRNGRVYLVRPSPTGRAAATSAVVRQPAQTTVPQNAQMVVRQPAQTTPQNAVIVRQTAQTTVPQNPLPVVNLQRPSNPSLHLPEKTELEFVPPTTAASSMPAVVNTLRAVPTLKLMPEKPILTQRSRLSQIGQRPGLSLLKPNVLNQSPTSSPNVSPVNSPYSSPMPSPSAKAISHRVILPKPAVSPVSTSTYRSKLYKQMLSTAVRSCPTKSCAGGVGRAIRWMVRNVPLISPEARNAEYQVLHPYCAPNTDTFLNWNLGKQRACELMRAQTVWRLLKDVGWDECDLWTVREILIWARFHGYTPGLPLTGSDGDIETSTAEEVCNYKPVDEEVTKWLTKQENRHLSESVGDETSDEELDIVGVNLPPSNVRVKEEPLERNSNCLTDPVEDMPFEETLLGVNAFVTQVLNNIGIQLEPEQLVTGVRYPAAQRVLVQAVQSLVDDLVRRSLAKAWGPNIARSPRSIEVPHVCSAMLSRPEFDFLTCAGLGINSVPSTTGVTSNSNMKPSNPS